VVFAAVLLTRSPLLVPLYGLRPVILVWLIDRGHATAGTLPRRAWWAPLAGAVLVALAYVAGPAVLRLVFGDAYDASGALMAALTAGAALIVLLTITGLALIAVDRHAGATRGWLCALATSVLLLMLPGTVGLRASLALTLGPACGLVWHLVELRRSAAAES
jgi:O-antigen/teichoic acid export membrane protein